MKWLVTAGNRLQPRRHLPLGRQGACTLAKRIATGKTPSHIWIDSQQHDGLRDACRTATNWWPSTSPRQALKWRIKTGPMPADVFGTPDDKTAAGGPDRRRQRGGVRRERRRSRKLSRKHQDRRGRARLPRRGRRAPRVREQPRGQHHQQDRPADAGRWSTPIPRRAAPTAWRCSAGGKLLLVTSRWARKLTVIDTETQQGGAAGQGGQVAAWRLDAGPRAALSRCAAPALVAGAAARRCRRARPQAQALRQARLPHLRHRPHGRGAAGRRGAEAPAACKVTFFAANERTQDGRRQPGQRTGRPGGRRGRPKATSSPPTPGTTSTGAATCRATPPRFRVRASAGAREAGGTSPGRPRSTAPRSTRPPSACEEITGKQAAAAVPRAGRQDLAAAPGGRARPAATRMWAGRRPASWATSCPAKRVSNAALLTKALRDIRSGDILLAHLGIWSRKDPWAPAVLEPLIVGPEGEGLLLCDAARASRLTASWIAAARNDRPWTGSTDAFAAAQQWLFETAVQPLMFSLGLGNLLEDGYAATGWLLVGLIQIAVLLAVIGPLQRWRPVEPVTDRARHPHRHPLHADPPAGPVPPGAVLHASSRCSTSCSAAARGRAAAPCTSTSCWPGVTDHALGQLRCSTWWCSTSSTTGSTAASTASTGGGACIRCTTRSAR